MMMMRRSRYPAGEGCEKVEVEVEEGERQSRECVLALPTMNESNVFTARDIAILNSLSGFSSP